ncbi:MAG: protein-glutamate O-methyltransferase CheR [Alphaproteobacteria bacterium]|nr:protein-glutamate O-methyltransferase CheR [Alphaproteobacteria bacterium]
MSATAERVWEFEWRDQDFKFLAGLLHDKTGIVLTEKKKEMMYGRLVRRLRALKLASFAEYCRYLQGPSGEKELGFTLNAITTNTTDFFREKHHFDYLRDIILPSVAAQIAANSGHHFRIWSAGCSSGEEPYSIAMVMRNILGNTARNSKILATDLDSNILGLAKAGQYNGKKCRTTIPAFYLKSATGKTGDSGENMVQMSNDLKKLISFRQLNLLHDWPMKGKFDAIFCRNVMIYFDKETQDRLVRRYATYLKADGILFIGHSESLLSVPDVYECLGKTIYRLLL